MSKRLSSGSTGVETWTYAEESELEVLASEVVNGFYFSRLGIRDLDELYEVIGGDILNVFLESLSDFRSHMSHDWV